MFIEDPDLFDIDAFVLVQFSYRNRVGDIYYLNNQVFMT